MTNYCLGICQFCQGAMTLQEIQEGVLWEEQERGYIYGYMWFGDDEEVTRVAHRRCWKELKEWERRIIRKKADEGPRSMGQRV